MTEKIACPYRVAASQPLCQIVSELTDLPVEICHTNDGACRHCLTLPVAPQIPNVVVASMCCGAYQRAGLATPRHILDVITIVASPEPTLDSLPCAHRGPEVRRQECKPCQAGGGPLLVPVFSCPIHTECTLRKIGVHPQIKGCLMCEERQIPAQLAMGATGSASVSVP